MRVQFVQRDRGPERLVCEAEILFDDGSIAKRLKDWVLQEYAAGQGREHEV